MAVESMRCRVLSTRECTGELVSPIDEIALAPVLDQSRLADSFAAFVHRDKILL